MGVICGGGMLICLVPMLTLLPVLLLRGKQDVPAHESKPAWTCESASRASGYGGQ